MDTTYDPNAIEQQWYDFWEQNGYFKASEPNPNSVDVEPYCIAIPPPNVTGTLHMGHAFQHTLMDILIRFNRMKGKPTLWQVGTDHAGIATQMVVERRLNAQGIKRHDLGREKFLEKIWEWKEESGGNICQQMRRLGNSVDWERERFTMDDGLSEAVQTVFIKLFDEGIIYRGKRLVNWDPVLQTAISDLEVISEEESGYMWHMRYPIAGTDEHLIVATTRPETMLGDSAVAVHPKDERYQSLVGKMIELPLSGRQIPIIADDYVDPEFGTGCVKITPAHDFNDYQVGQRHGLPLINIFNDTAHINDAAPEAYRGLERYKARKQIVADLDATGLLEKVADHKLMVPRGDRTNVVIEPYLTDQWYVAVDSIAKPAIEAVENGDIRFVPENWSKTYFNWMRNLDDWCISRQLWWGHRIPAWFDNDGNIYVAEDETAVRKKYNLAAELELKQETDVLDTWFSSALWPFSTLGWPNNTQELEQFYPNNVLVTGFDIIFFWVARMVMFGQKFMDDVPFKDVYITGLIRDENGHKMSKSKGNTLDPLDLIDGIDLEALVAKRTSGMMQPQLAAKIEKSTRKQFPNGIAGYGTDALRFTLASLASTGRDIRFDMQRMEGYRNFCNKLWNAARYVLMNTEEHAQDLQNDEIELSLADKWIIGRLQQTEQEVTRLLEQYRFDLAAQEIYEFTWDQYCDWYIELSKPVLNNPNATAAELRGTRQTLIKVLETLLRIAHPLIPFVTESIWQTVAPLAGIKGDSIMIQPYPIADMSKVDNAVIEEIEWIKTFVIGVRKIRSEMNVKPSKQLSVILDNTTSTDQQRINNNAGFLKTLARLENIIVLQANEDAPESAIALVGEMKLLIPLAGIIDKDAELARLDREIAKANAEIENVNKKLGNAGFVDKAPEAVVAKEKSKLAEAQSRSTELLTQRKKIAEMDTA